MKLRKAVILTAGLGSRFYPVTKAIPKTMLPIVDKPIIQMLVEEAVDAGIEEVLVITGPNQEAVHEHFKSNPELNAILKARGKTEELAALEAVETSAKLEFAIQETPKGDGDAILHAEAFANGEPFAVLFGDELIDGSPSALKQLVQVHEAAQTSVIGTQRVEGKAIEAYGVIAPETDNSQETVAVKGLVEKPAYEDAPSNRAIIGKYICDPGIFEWIRHGQSSHGTELRLIDGFRQALEEGAAIHAHEIQGERFDTGNKLGWLKANQHFAKKRGLL